MQGSLGTGETGAGRRAKVVPWRPDAGFIGDAVCAIGAFDGVHVGHRFLISEMIRAARQLGVAAVVVTFDVDPDELLSSHPAPRKLLINEDRINLLSRTGADYVLVVPFTRELAALRYDEFLEQVLGSFMHLRGIHVGCDFKLGYKALGTVGSMTDWGVSRGCPVKGYPLLERKGHPVTATRIRDLLGAGQMEVANCLLGRPFYVRGTVVEGRHEGSQLGFPTANVQTTMPYTPVADGVYAGWCAVDGICYPSAINAGYPPTFEGREKLCKLEPHLIGFAGDLYGRELEVSFSSWLRGPVKFPSLEALIATVKGNISWTEGHLGRCPADELGFPVREGEGLLA